jgi:Fur family peroxide stress response transcriptional regulator
MGYSSEADWEQKEKPFREKLRRAGIKVTPQRMLIFRQLALSGDHPDAGKVYFRVREHLPAISLDTVYRTLWLFLDLGLITTLGTTRERTRFDANLEQHHHFVCSHCGMTRDFYSKEFDQLKIPETVNDFGKPDKAQVEIKGICKTCSKNAGKRTGN